MTRLLMRVWVVLLAVTPVWAGPKADEVLEALRKRVHADPVVAPALRTFAEKRLLEQSVNPVFVREARKQNARKAPLADIQAADKEWIAGAPDMPLKKSLLSNEASKEMLRLLKDLPPVREAFVMDDQGALVGSSGLTSDYWQGDESKWKDSYAAGKGGVSIAAAEFDASAGQVLQQISLPLLDQEGNVVGAITWGVVLEKIERDSRP